MSLRLYAGRYRLPLINADAADNAERRRNDGDIGRNTVEIIIA